MMCSPMTDDLFGKGVGAILSEDRLYRYALWRIWDTNKPFALFIGLNPSTADETEDDPTIRRCVRFATEWAYGGLYMANLFAFRATDPSVMTSCPSPVGPDNDHHLLTRAKEAGVIVCAWGTHGAHQERDTSVTKLLSDYDLKCLGQTKDGHPRHPLYIRADKTLEPYGS